MNREFLGVLKKVLTLYKFSQITWAKILDASPAVVHEIMVESGWSPPNRVLLNLIEYVRNSDNAAAWDRLREAINSRANGMAPGHLALGPLRRELCDKLGSLDYEDEHQLLVDTIAFIHDRVPVPRPRS